MNRGSQRSSNPTVRGRTDNHRYHTQPTLTNRKTEPSRSSRHDRSRHRSPSGHRSWSQTDQRNAGRRPRESRQNPRSYATAAASSPQRGASSTSSRIPPGNSPTRKKNLKTPPQGNNIDPQAISNDSKKAHKSQSSSQSLLKPSYLLKKP